MDNTSFTLGSFNVRGITKEFKQKQLAMDMMKYGVDVCCLQEMKIEEGIDKQVDKYRLISLKPENKHYGNGFIISPKWINNIHRYNSNTINIFKNGSADISYSLI